MTTPSLPRTPTQAWVRAPTTDYAACLRGTSGGPSDRPPDPAEAIRQHAGYVAALRDAGVEVIELPAARGLPDGCFVEDLAVVLGEAAILTRPGAPSRREEAPSIEAALAPTLSLTRMHEPGTLDGGDVLRLGARLVVGRSQRTNDAGIEQLRAFAAPLGLEVVAVDVARGLHLKSACTALDDHTIVLDPRALDPVALQPLGLTVHRVPEPVGANVLRLGDRVLVSASAPRTAQWLAQVQGLHVVSVPLSAMHAGDGALSCLSLRRAPPGAWVV